MFVLTVMAALASTPSGAFIPTAGPNEMFEDAYAAALARFLAYRRSIPWSRAAEGEDLGRALTSLGLVTIGTECEAVRHRILDGAVLMWGRLPPSTRTEHPLLGALQCSQGEERLSARRLLAGVSWVAESPK